MSVPAGWYPDPSPGSTLERFWDGESWTDDVRGPSAPPDRTEPAGGAGQQEGREPGSDAPAGAGRFALREGRTASGTEDGEGSHLSRSEARLHRSLQVFEGHTPAPLAAQFLRWMVDVALSSGVAAAAALAASTYALQVPPMSLLLLLLGPILAAYRSICAALSIRTLGEKLSGTVLVVAVSSRRADLPSQLPAAALTSASFAAAAAVPELLVLPVLDLLFASSSSRQSLSDRAAGTLVVRA